MHTFSKLICSAVLVASLVGSTVVAQNGIKPRQLDPVARVRTLPTIASLATLTSTPGGDDLRDGELVWCPEVGAFLTYDAANVKAVDNKDVYDAGASYPGDFIRGPIGQIPNYTTTQRNALRYPAGRTFLIRDTTENKTYYAIGTGLGTPPTFEDQKTSVILTWRGVWASPGPYSIRDIVRHNNAMYIANDAVTVEVPGVSGKWDLVVDGAGGHDAVTLSGTPDYITLSGQDIVRGQIVLTTDVSGILPIANIATGTPDGTKFVRDDGTLAVPAGGGGSPVTATTAGLQKRHGFFTVGDAASFVLQDTSSYFVGGPTDLANITGMVAADDGTVIQIFVASTGSVVSTGNIQLDGSEGDLIEPTFASTLTLWYRHADGTWYETSRTKF